MSGYTVLKEVFNSDIKLIHKSGYGIRHLEINGQRLYFCAEEDYKKKPILVSWKVRKITGTVF